MWSPGAPDLPGGGPRSWQNVGKVSSKSAPWRPHSRPKNFLRKSSFFMWIFLCVVFSPLGALFCLIFPTKLGQNKRTLAPDLFCGAPACGRPAKQHKSSTKTTGARASLFFPERNEIVQSPKVHPRISENQSQKDSESKFFEWPFSSMLVPRGILVFPEGVPGVRGLRSGEGSGKGPGTLVFRHSNNRVRGLRSGKGCGKVWEGHEILPGIGSLQMGV